MPTSWVTIHSGGKKAEHLSMGSAGTTEMQKMGQMQGGKNVSAMKTQHI